MTDDAAEAPIEAELMARVAARDHEAFATLYDRHVRAVYGAVLRYLRDPAAAEEVVQETYLAMWQQPGRYAADKGSLVGWLLSTLVPSFGFVIPASLAVVYWWASSHEAVEESVVAGEPARERAQALAELERDPRNAAAHWAIARSYESEKKFDLALEHYERAHGIDERTMPRQELDDARDRLSAAAVPDTANPHLEEQVRADARRARWERRILYFSLLLILVNRAWAANLCATMLFLGWFSPIKRNC